MSSPHNKKLVTVLAVLSLLIIIPTSAPSVTAKNYRIEGSAEFAHGTRTDLTLTAQGLSLAVTSSQWVNVSAANQPPARECFQMAYDSKMDETVMYGGFDGHIFYADTWAINLTTGTWTNKAPSNDAGSLDEHTMDYDSKEGKFVLFGGFVTNNDTWTYDLATNNWTHMSPPLSPSARAYQAMTYDSINDKMIMFSGYNGGAPDDTWAYDLSTDTWTNMNPAVQPSARDFTSMAFDSDRGEAVIFGGTNGVALDDTWAYNLTTNTWTNKNPTNHPSARGNHVMTYDHQMGKFLLFGGGNGPTDYGDTWTYDLGTNTWALVSSGNAPHARTCAAMTYDSRAKKVLLTGGDDINGTLYNDLWTFQGSSPDSGTYVSAPFDTGGFADFGTLVWKATVPTNTTVRFQFRSADTNYSLQAKDFVGPDGTPSSLYTQSGRQLNIAHNGSRWFQYKVYLSRSDPSKTPVLNQTTVNYNLWPLPPVLIFPSITDKVNISKPSFLWIFYDKDTLWQGAFEWQLDNDKNFTSVDSDSGIVLTSNTSYTPHTAIPDGTWYWRVRARDSEGAWGPYSLVWSFVINASVGVPNPYVKNMSVDKLKVPVGQHATITATIANNGTANASNVQVMFYDGAVLVGTKNISVIMNGNTVVTFDWDTTNAINGTHVLKIVVKQSTKETSVFVDTFKAVPNPYVKDMTVDRSSMIIGQHVTITAMIANNGTANANSVIVIFYDGATQLGTHNIAVPMNSTIKSTFEWDTTGVSTGNHVLKVTVGQSLKDRTVNVNPKNVYPKVKTSLASIWPLIIVIIIIISAVLADIAIRIRQGQYR